MSPSQEAVEIPETGVHLVVAGGTNRHDIEKSLRFLSDRLCQSTDARVRADLLTVLHARIDQFARNDPVDKNARNHERPEEVALAAFIDTKVRLEHLRRMNFFVTEFRFAQNLRLQLELDELFHLPTLHENF